MRIVNALIICVLTLLPNNSCGLSLLINTPYEAEGLEIYLRPDLSKYGPFSHACKMSDGKNYFAVLGASNGTVFVNYTNQNLEDDDIQFFPGAPSLWRECRSYNHPQTGNTYAYVVTEGPDFKEYPGGIQIFKLGDQIELVNTYTDIFFNSAHTIFIDTERGLAFVNGSRWQGNLAKDTESHKDHLGGLRILDIKTDPEHPRNIGFYNKSYTHDSYGRYPFFKTLFL